MAMNSIGEFVLIIGDIHIPQRAASLPEQFRDLLMPGKMQHVVCPGNVGSREVSGSEAPGRLKAALQLPRPVNQRQLTA